MPLSKQIIFDILDAIPQLWDTVELNTDIIIGSGYVPVKSRDEREPMRMQKIKVERKLRSLFQRRFKRQLEVLAMTGVQKAKPKPRIPIDLPEWEDEDYIDELVAVIYEASKYGIALFAEQVIIGLDYTLSSAEALAWAKKYSYELIKGIDETTRDIISNAISSFIETPGFTIRDVMDELTDFSEKRAATIAVTETTRAFAEGQKLAGEELRKEFPDMKIEKTWFTNNDDRVCDICGPLDGKSVAYEDEFDAEGPPAHVNCRCWIEFNTRSGD